MLNPVSMEHPDRQWRFPQLRLAQLWQLWTVQQVQWELCQVRVCGLPQCPRQAQRPSQRWRRVCWRGRGWLWLTVGATTLTDETPGKYCYYYYYPIFCSVVLFLIITNTRMLNNMLVNKQEITIETKKYLEINGNNNKTTQNLGNSAKAVLRWKFIAIQFYLKKQEKSQVNNLSLPKLFLVRKRRTNKI